MQTSDKIIIGFLGALLLISSLLFLQDKFFGSSDEDIFSVENINDITSIKIQQKGGSDVLLERQTEGVWTVNEDHIVRPQAIQTLLTTLEKTEAKQAVGEEAHEHVLKQMLKAAVRVDVFEDDTDASLIFLVGSNTPGNTGTYMLRIMENGEPADQIYITHIPGFKGFLSNRFITDAKSWRTREVFNHLPKDITSVSVDYPTNPEASFQLFWNDEKWMLYSPTEEAVLEPSQALAEQYISFFAEGSIEAFENDYSKQDSILMNGAFAHIKLLDLVGDSSKVSLYFKPTGKRTKLQYDEYGRAVEYDKDRYFALVNNGEDFAVVQEYVFGKYLRDLSEFLVAN